jgi:hypothetical protein
MKRNGTVVQLGAVFEPMQVSMRPDLETKSSFRIWKQNQVSGSGNKIKFPDLETKSSFPALLLKQNQVSDIYIHKKFRSYDPSNTKRIDPICVGRFCMYDIMK